MVRAFHFGQLFDFIFLAVVAGHRKAMIGHIQNKIASHDPQPDQADIALLIFLLPGHILFFLSFIGSP
jgi:hypothetical protein